MGTGNGELTVLTKDHLVQASKAIHDELEGAMDERFKDLETDLAVRVLKLLERKLDKRLKDVEIETRKRLEADYDARVKLLERLYQQGFEQMKSLFKEMPAPNIAVTIPEGSIRAVVPKDAIAVQIEAKAVLETPRQKSIVNKSIIYGADGRPSQIVEETTQE